MEHIELRTQSRTIRGKQVRRLRSENWIPAVVYGPDMLPQVIQAQERLLFNTLKEAGSTTLINLFVDDEPKPRVVLAREIQRSPLSGSLLHVDFYEVRLTEMVKTTPRLEFVGESPLVRSGSAVMIYGMNEVEVECLPTDLINSIDVDVSALEELDDSIVVGDLPVPSGVTILADPSDVVVSLVSTLVALEEEVEEEEIFEDEEGEEEIPEEE
jgi:large subunit ribosomal protein L25